MELTIPAKQCAIHSNQLPRGISYLSIFFLSIEWGFTATLEPVFGFFDRIEACHRIIKHHIPQVLCLQIGNFVSSIATRMVIANWALNDLPHQWSVSEGNTHQETDLVLRKRARNRS